MDLRSCYFCGTVDDALDTTAIPGDDDPVQVTLCLDCRAKLERVLEAVAGIAVDRERSEDGPSSAGDPPSDEPDGVVRASGDVTFDARPDAGDGDGNGGGGAGGRATDDAGADGEPDKAGDGESTGESDEKGEGTDPDEPAETEGDTARDRSDSADGGDLRGLDAAGRGKVGTYRKALRLLRNREFPMERAAVVDLLGSAYDLGPAECDRLVEFAVEKGVLVEEGTELRRA